MVLNKKQFLILIVLWFLFSFLIMWFFGGACTSPFVEPSKVSSVCLSSNSLNFFANIPILGLFLPYYTWVSFMYWFAPIAGFIFAFIVIRWYNNHFDTEEASGIWFLPLIIIFLLLGFFINLGWYYGETAASATRQNSGLNAQVYFCFESDATACNNTVSKLNNEYISQAKNSGATTVTQLLNVNYWSELRQSIFLTFVIGAIAAWLPLFVLNTIDIRKKKKDKKVD